MGPETLVERIVAPPAAPTSEEIPVPPPSTPSAGSVSSPSPPSGVYSIAKTKKGGLPVRVESRGKGKKVTVVFNVTGDASKLLQELKQAAGCGGVLREGTLEIQGDKLQFVEKFIKNK